MMTKEKKNFILKEILKYTIKIRQVKARKNLLIAKNIYN